MDLAALEGDQAARPGATLEHWRRVYQWCMTGQLC